jgi:hypothetical protein
MRNFRKHLPTKNVNDVCLYPQNWWRIFRRGVRTLQGERVFQRPTPTPKHKGPESNRGTPARSESLAALPWATLLLGVDVDHHPRGARAPIAGHPRITPCVVHTPLEASQAIALLVGTRSLSGHDHAISSSMSWS